MRIAQVMGGAAHGRGGGLLRTPVLALRAAGETVLAVIRRDAGRTARLRAGAASSRWNSPSAAASTSLTAPPPAPRRWTRFAPDVVMAWMNRAAAMPAARGAARRALDAGRAAWAATTT